MRSDLALLARAAFGYLPLAMVGVGIAAPLAMLLLVVSDQLSAAVSSAAGNASGHFLDVTSGIVGVLTVFSQSPFLAFLVGAFTAAAALALWLELLVREAAVYVIVLMLPLAFAALVWPARRIWAIRAVELLVALILSKFAIVAVLSLGGAAVSNSIGGASVTGAIAGGALVLMAAFAPWALLRLLPLAELASGAAGSLRGEGRPAMETYTESRGRAQAVENLLAGMRDQVPEAGVPDIATNGDSPGGPDNEPPADAAEGAPTGPLAQLQGSNGESGTNGAPGTNGAAGAAGAVGANAPPAETDERLPGMDSIWQMKDGEWEPVVLGDDLPPPTPPPAEEEP
jgi:hypothetical protein